MQQRVYSGLLGPTAPIYSTIRAPYLLFALPLMLFLLTRKCMGALGGMKTINNIEEEAEEGTEGEEEDEEAEAEEEEEGEGEAAEERGGGGGGEEEDGSIIRSRRNRRPHRKIPSERSQATDPK